MYISYFDETGDDGYPVYSSELFVLTSLYSHFQNWKDNYQKIFQFRQFAKQKYNLPIKTELHTKNLLLNKRPYRNLCLDTSKRYQLIIEIAEMIASLSIKVINVCIDKTKINSSNIKMYKNILDVALNFNVQRIENDINKIDPGSKFIIITDEGRTSKMQNTTRRIQKINYIPSQFSPSTYRHEIRLLIEDPLPKNSRNSYFIQIADFISYFVYLKNQNPSCWANRLSWFTPKHLDKVIEIVRPILNTDASKDNPNGFVCYPK